MDVSTSTVAKMIPAKIQWPGGPSMKQHFSLPSSIIYYMAMNPSSPETYNKLIQSCKYFFEKNPILVANRLSDIDICSCVNDEYGDFQYFDDIDIKKLKSKIWLTGELICDERYGDEEISVLYPKLYRCDISFLSISEMDILYDDFKCLTSSVKCIGLDNVKMTYSNGKPVMLENILEVIPNVEYFDYEFPDGFSVTTASTLKNIAKLQNLGNLQILCFFDVPQVFNVEELSAFMKEFKDTKISFTFTDDISPEYKDQLEALIDTIIQSDNYYRVVRFSGQDSEKLKIMENRIDNEVVDAFNGFGGDGANNFALEDVDNDGSLDDIDEDDVDA